jgi:N-methylhydantoinase A
MRGFITDMTVAQGRDPRQCVMVAGGGAAGLNIVRIARDLGVRQVVIPRLAAGLSATGGQFSDISATFSTGRYANSSRFDYEAVNEALSELEQALTRFLDEVDHPGERRLRFVCEARYDQQVWEIDVDLGDLRRFDGPRDLALLHERFDQAHLGLFAVNQPHFPIEIVTWRGEGRITRARPALTAGIAEKSTDDVEVGSRIGWFSGEPIEMAIYRVQDAPPPIRIEGPAVIEEPTTTIVLDPGSVAVGRPTHYLVEVAEVESSGAIAETLRMGA